MQLRSLIEEIQIWSYNHPQNKRFHFDAREQTDNFVTSSSEFPVVFMSPTFSTPIINSNGYAATSSGFVVECYDRINNDRTNIVSILNNTQNILNDLIIHLKNLPHLTIDSINFMEPLNNETTDLLAGYSLTINLTTPMKTVCVDTSVIKESIVNIYNTEDTLLDTLNVTNAAVIEYITPDGTVVLKDQLGGIIDTVSVPSGSEEEYILSLDTASVLIENENGDVLYDELVTSGSSNTYVIDNTDLELTITNTDNSYVDIIDYDLPSSTINTDTLVLPDTTIQISINGIPQGTIDVPIYKNETINIL